ncbi:MAG: hypothetical protein U5Q16_17720 [Gammaproteobacteria bacterium]|nr:hypothetical protein [Gammaproteobacteria bacterium]
MTLQSAQHVAVAAWWLPTRVSPGHTLDCRLGPLRLQIHRAPGEWQVATFADAESVEAGHAELVKLEGAIDAEDFQRYMFSREDEGLRLVPVLLDRPVVIRPRQPVFLPSGEETTLYMSSPVMVRVEVGEPPVTLCEIPTVRLSDSWFGSSTREGELCYAGRTHARQHADEVPRRSYRAITAARIRNEASTPLLLERVSLPIPALSVYGTAEGQLWTESVALVRGSNSELAALHIDDAPPDHAGAAERLCPPRHPQSRGTLVRAFSALFGDRQ